MIVMDSCALVEMARQTYAGKALYSLYRQGEKTISCDLVRVEVASVVRKLKRQENLSAEAAEQCFADAMNLIDDLYPMEDLDAEALRESMRLDHAVYDMFYFVLARRTGGTLFTLDQSLQNLCWDNGVDCLAEVDFPTPEGIWESQ